MKPSPLFSKHALRSLKVVTPALALIGLLGCQPQEGGMANHASREDCLIEASKAPTAEGVRLGEVACNSKYPPKSLMHAAIKLIPQRDLIGISLGDTKEEAIFTVGNALELEGKNGVFLWYRDLHLMVMLRANKVIRIDLNCKGAPESLNLSGIYCGMPIPIKFNSLYVEPKALVAASPDHLERTFAFPDFGIYYRAVASKVVSLGVYDANFYPDGVLYNGD